MEHTAPEETTVAPKAVTKRPAHGWIAVAITIAILMTATGFGLWKVAEGIRSSVKSLADDQNRQLTSLGQNLNDVVAIYKNQEKGENQEKTNAVVLGASIAREEGDRVLGLEDDPTIVRERTLMGKLQDGQAMIAAIQTTDQNVTTRYIGIATYVLPKETPIAKTEQFSAKLTRIYDYFRRAADRDIRSAALGFNLGVSMQMAVTTPDERTIGQLDRVIMDFKNMVEEEKNTDTNQLPADLLAFHQKIVKADEEMIAGIAKLPELFRQRDVQGIKDNLNAFLTSAMMTSATGQVDLVSFWQKDSTVGLFPEITKTWKDYLDKL
jgi:hypothetical protein